MDHSAASCPDFSSVGEGLDANERNEAGFMNLRAQPVSQDANDFIVTLLTDVVMPAWPTGLQKRASSIEGCRKALGALFADLLYHHARSGKPLGKYGMGNGDFTGLGFSRDLFVRCKDALVEAGLLQYLNGWRWFGDGFAAGKVTGSSVSGFKLTPAAMRRLSLAGLIPQSFGEWQLHWDRPAAEVPAAPKTNQPLVVVRAEKAGWRQPGKRLNRMSLKVNLAHPKVRETIEQLQAHNAFMAAKGVTGVPFAGLKRVFNNGDVPGFDYQSGGRFASLPGGGYENENKAMRLALMRMAGERVGEVDIRASHLTFAMALSGTDFDAQAEDPYAVAGINRELVKRWINQTVGRGDTIANRWSDDARGWYAKEAPGRLLREDYPIAVVREAVLRAYPGLRALEGDNVLSSGVLMYHESEVMMAAMALLREQGVPSLPVHDCLAVPLNGLEAAKVAISQSFSDHVEKVIGRRSTVVPYMHLLTPEDA